MVYSIFVQFLLELEAAVVSKRATGQQGQWITEKPSGLNEEVDVILEVALLKLW
jgi:hypothetical protein